MKKRKKDKNGLLVTWYLTRKVLVAGGVTTNGITGINSAEIYDPMTGNWTKINDMHEKRYAHTATVLPNGKVMIIGGISSTSDTMNSYELYDPVTGNWTLHTMPIGYAVHETVMLPNGKLLIVGGTCQSCEFGQSILFDPNTGKWTRTGSLPDVVWFHTATLLSNGKVLVTGGESEEDPGIINCAELYDSSTGKWSIVDPMKFDRADHTATVLKNGDILITGGDSYVDEQGRPEKTVELYNSSTEEKKLSFNDKKYW